MSEARIDARGLKCPWPALRLARAMRGATSVTMIADDPMAPAEIAALAQAHGWSVERNEQQFSVRRG